MKNTTPTHQELEKFHKAAIIKTEQAEGPLKWAFDALRQNLAQLLTKETITNTDINTCIEGTRRAIEGIPDLEFGDSDISETFEELAKILKISDRLTRQSAPTETQKKPKEKKPFFPSSWPKQAY